MKIFTRTRSGVSVLAIASVLIAGGALAQDQAAADADNTASDDTETVVVTGLRRSLATAQAIKQNSDQIVDSITATDIGKFPDVNIAESLQRIPGIQIQRIRGEGQQVLIRGLTRVRTELNGHDIFSANGGVGLSYDEIGPDLLSRVDVYKNPSSDMIEGSLAGTVNLITRKPFDAKGRVMSATASVTNYDLAKETGESYSALYSNRWSTRIGEIGFLANASYQKSAFREDLVQMEPYYYHGPCVLDSGGNLVPVTPTPNGSQLRCTPVPGHETENILVPDGGGFNVGSGSRKRSSQNIVLQWRPNDDFEAYAQLFNSDYRFIDAGNSYFINGNATPVGTYQVEDGVAVAGARTGTGGISIIYGGIRKTRTTEFSTGFKWQVTPNLRLDADYEHLDSKVNRTGMNTYLFLDAGNYNYVFDNTGDFPIQGSDTPNFLSDPTSYSYGAIQPFITKNTAEADALKLDLTWDFDDGFFKQFKSGVRYSRKDAMNRDANTWNGIFTPVEDNPEFVEINPGQASILRGDGADLVFGPVLQWLGNDTLNHQDAFAHYKTLTGITVGYPDISDPLHRTFSPIEQDDVAFYLRTTFGSQLGGFDFDGNLGVRYVQTEATGEGYQALSYRTSGGANPTVVQTEGPLSGGNKYNVLLPSFNLRVHLTENLQARFAYSKNIYRPDFTQLNPTFSYSPNYTDQNALPNTVDQNNPYNATTNPYQGSFSRNGNPNLNPERVTSYDLSFEWYFAKDGSLTIDFFKKDLVDLIATRGAEFTETIPGVGVVRFNGSELTNVTSGYVEGFEISGQKFFDFLPGAWSGLGIAANYTLADSNAGTIASTTVGGTPFAVPLEDLSKDSYNLMLLYDKYGWNARVAYNWRSTYLDTVSETGAVSLPVYFKAYGSLDASVSYDLNDHVSFTIDGQNLTDTVQKTFFAREILRRNYQINDRRVSARIRLKY
ncbi:TonB-dependent receptor [Asticcacaulis sp. SL142]|uniref:TonB-dependent receptor n=1 Tax=Asticcacaulis sp. SL142 TaxID=2995155 RepID=UPI00226CAC75|nr:TonB-dependent receptor [Asticcacaulis sp. SL142]WAC49447.1 TonB-dependent receptor [Asticcacaulis sp. SL142]